MDYDGHRALAREAVDELEQATAIAGQKRAQRDARVRAMIATGASLGTVAKDLGLTKSLIATIHRASDSADAAILADD